MTRLLLDTHALLWALFDPARLPRGVREHLLDPSQQVLVSVASAWEIAIKQSIGKLVLPGPLHQGVADLGFEFLPVTPAHCARFAQLPLDPGHRDPFDRMLVVQANAEGCLLVSRDRALAEYGVQLMW